MVGDGDGRSGNFSWAAATCSIDPPVTEVCVPLVSFFSLPLPHFFSSLLRLIVELKGVAKQEEIKKENRREKGIKRALALEVLNREKKRKMDKWCA